MQAAVRALTLLLDNARKFSAKSADQHVKLHIEALPSSVQFAIEDNGIGVPAKEAEHIFDEFVQLDAYYEGTGIGLTVARSMARRMGGDIQLDTDFNPGARFVMTLPR
jgi:signal transduction histidine kinase